jgi:hypothetical protein
MLVHDFEPKVGSKKQCVDVGVGLENAAKPDWSRTEFTHEYSVDAKIHSVVRKEVLHHTLDDIVLNS